MATPAAKSRPSSFVPDGMAVKSPISASPALGPANSSSMAARAGASATPVRRTGATFSSRTKYALTSAAAGTLDELDAAMVDDVGDNKFELVVRLPWPGVEVS